MDIKQLRYFIAIAEERQITAAAKRLHMTQPPLSQQLANMEEKLGVKLVHRNGNYLELTHEGKALYKNALRIVNLVEESNMEVKEIGSGARGKLLLGVNTLSHHSLPKLLITFQEKYPKVSYKIHQKDSGQLCNLLHERKIELAIVRLPVETQVFSMIPLMSESFYFVTSRQVKLEKRVVCYEDMQDYPLILPSTEGLGLHQFILEQLSKRGLEENIICESSDILLLLKLVSLGFGATIIPQSVLKLHKNYHVNAYKIEDDTFVSSSGLIWRKDHYLSKGSQNFIQLIKDSQRQV